MAKRLGLVWPHKGEHVLCNPSTGKWEFCGLNPLSPRPLIEIEAFGEEADITFSLNRSNLLIKGDNIYVHKCLQPIYAGQVKLIYIDPPFNTGDDSSFIPYEDNYEHSVWLSMMEERLIQLKYLLHKSGIIIVHIDYRELHYLKVLMDSIFTRDNFLSMITLEVKDPAGVGQQSPIFDVCEYLLIYVKDMDTFRKTKSYKSTEDEIQYGKVRGYSKAFIHIGNGTLVTTIQRAHVGEVKIFKVDDCEIEKLSRDISTDEYYSKFNSIFADYNPDGGMVLAIKDRIPRKGLSYIEYVPSKGKCAGQLTKIYFINQRIISMLQDVYQPVEPGVYIKSQKVTNYWKVITANLGGEGGVDLPKGKKPEALISKLLNLYTQPNDLVLDAFAGAGTTAAVAHKMNRRWIAIEHLDDYIMNKCLPRLQHVIAGTDSTGITAQTQWQGGGGFRFLEVGAPLFIEDPETQLDIINPHYSNGPLVRAVCAVEGFLLTGHEVLHGKNGEHYAHVTEDFIDNAYVGRITAYLRDNQSLTIYAAKGVTGKLVTSARVYVKRINKDLIKKYCRR